MSLTKLGDRTMARRGRRPKGLRAMTHAERQRAYMARLLARTGTATPAPEIEPPLRLPAAEAAERERDEALKERDRVRLESDRGLAAATRLISQLTQERDEAERERDQALMERDRARQERDALRPPR
jgi:hypothetical protein